MKKIIFAIMAVAAMMAKEILFFILSSLLNWLV